MGDQFIFVTILVKLAVMASIASILVRYRSFKTLLFSDFDTWEDRGKLLLFFGFPITISTAARVLLGFNAADISLEGTLGAGLMGGRSVGVLIGVLSNLPCLLNGEYLAPLMGLLTGLAGGMLHVATPRRDVFWNFSPLFFLSFPSSIRRMHADRHLDWTLVYIATALVLEATRVLAGLRFGHLFFLFSNRPVVLVAIFLATVGALGIPIKILNSTRIEIKLEEQERLLIRSRLEALISQIKPHFLFNTLNSISSAIRTDPEKARHLIVKLSHILRRLIDNRQDFVPLRDELDFIDSYLEIEVARFGPDKLHVVKCVDPNTLDVPIPAMLLQPIVENAVGHGIAPRIEGGTISLKSSTAGGRLSIVVSDDGVGIPSDGMAVALRDGVGLPNTIERLRVIYGEDHSFQVESTPGIGTVCRLSIPLTQVSNGNQNDYR